jgi:hypothetical protein
MASIIPRFIRRFERSRAVWEGFETQIREFVCPSHFCMIWGLYLAQDITADDSSRIESAGKHLYAT